MKRNEKKEREKLLIQFKGSLSKKKRLIFEKEIEPFLDSSGHISDSLENFNTGLGQRWIFDRVTKLGWDPTLHKEFDSNVSRNILDRRGHKSERIGKKYQWIALHELLGLVSDNFEFISEKWSREVIPYEGAWQTGIRDIDPSCTLKEVLDDEGFEEVPLINIFKPEYDAWKKSKSITSWLSDKKSIPKPVSIIELTDSDNCEWVMLEGYHSWEEEIPPEYEKYQLSTKTLYLMAKSYLIKKEDKTKMFDWAKKQKFYGRWMPESHSFYNIFIGEYPAYPAFLYHYNPYFNHNGWTDDADRKKIPAKILVTDDEYLSSGSSVDCSINKAITVKLPSKWIIDKMSLKQKYNDGRFYDKKGDLASFDPSVFKNSAPTSLLIRKDKLCSFLKKEKIDILWILLGEKQTIGGDGIGQPHGWQEINGAFIIDKNNKITGSIHSQFEKPTPQVKIK